MDLETANSLYYDISEAIKDYGILDRKNAHLTKSWELGTLSEKETYFEIPVDFFGLERNLSSPEYMKKFDMIEEKITPLIDKIVTSYTENGTWNGTWSLRKFVQPHLVFYSSNSSEEVKTVNLPKRTSFISYCLTKKKETMGLICSFFAMSFFLFEICK